MWVLVVFSRRARIYRNKAEVAAKLLKHLKEGPSRESRVVGVDLENDGRGIVLRKCSGNRCL
jgi:hypothetical protein